MKIFSWMDSRIKYLRWYDIGLIKLSVLGFSLFLAKLWPTILSLKWYVYLIIAVLAAVRPMYLMLKKRQPK